MGWGDNGFLSINPAHSGINLESMDMCKYGMDMISGWIIKKE